jgi:hypothetical protein
MIGWICGWAFVAGVGALFSLMPWGDELETDPPVPYDWRAHMTVFGYVLLWPLVVVAVPLVVMVTALCMATMQVPKNLRRLSNWALRLMAGGLALALLSSCTIRVYELPADGYSYAPPRHTYRHHHRSHHRGYGHQHCGCAYVYDGWCWHGRWRVGP